MGSRAVRAGGVKIARLRGAAPFCVELEANATRAAAPFPVRPITSRIRNRDAPASAVLPLAQVSGFSTLECHTLALDEAQMSGGARSEGAPLSHS